MVVVWIIHVKNGLNRPVVLHHDDPSYHPEFGGVSSALDLTASGKTALVYTFTSHGSLGISINWQLQPPKIEKVKDGSVAAKQGMLEGDELLEVNGTPVAGGDQKEKETLMKIIKDSRPLRLNIGRAKTTENLEPFESQPIDGEIEGEDWEDCGVEDASDDDDDEVGVHVAGDKPTYSVFDNSFVLEPGFSESCSSFVVPWSGYGECTLEAGSDPVRISVGPESPESQWGEEFIQLHELKTGRPLRNRWISLGQRSVFNLNANINFKLVFKEHAPTAALLGCDADFFELVPLDPRYAPPGETALVLYEEDEKKKRKR